VADNKKFRRKPSAHQKQIRFFTILSIVMVAVLVLGVLLLVNRSSLPGH
jgi:hypothetical protein